MRRAVPVLAAVAALALTGCGGDQRDSFRDDYRSLDAQIGTLGEDVGTTITGAANKPNGQLSARFDALARRARDLVNRLDDTDPPANLAGARDRLSRALRGIARDLRTLAGAAASGDGGSARTATVRIALDSPAVRNARAALSQALGR
jgi:hypothetical protein